MNTAEETIRRLAAQHGVDASPHPMSSLARDINRLSDAEAPEPDEVRRLLINLARKDFVTEQDATLLLVRYLRERAP